MEKDAFQLKPATYSVAQEFGLNLDPKVRISGFEPGHPGVPPIDSQYVFMPEKLRDLMAFWQSGEHALKIVGNPGTGKTSLIQQFHAHLRWPLYMVACSGSTEARQLIGQLVPTTDGSLRWADGPVLRAARENTSVLLDEYNLLDPGESSGLNMLLEGYSITVPETGEVIKPGPAFRIFATENAVTSRLTVAGRNVQDVANDDRWMYTTADYLSPDLEQRAIAGALQADGLDADSAAMRAKLVVMVANDIRRAFVKGDDVIEKPMTTRSALRWAKLIRRFATNVPEGPMIYALRRAFQMSEEMDKAVVTYAKAAVGIDQ